MGGIGPKNSGKDSNRARCGSIGTASAGCSVCAEDAGTAETARDQGEEFPDDEDVEGHMFGQLSGFTVTVNADSLNAFGVNNDTLFAGPGDDSRFDEISRRRKRF